MNLRDILACPTCKMAVELMDGYFFCRQCKCRYPIVNGVPIMLPGGAYTDIQYEFPLDTREEYAPWLHRMILQSLTDEQIVVDIGSGNMKIDDPCIIRTDVKLTPYVDLVADIHTLPFLPNSLDYIFALAVFEHLRQPFEAAEEIYRALKPGGYVYAEANFVYPYHGYPHHYFNISTQGLKELFSKFTILKVGVAPYQMPGFALDFIFATYLDLFKPETSVEFEFADKMRDLLQHPLQSYDRRIDQGQAFRMAAGDYLIGMKQLMDTDTIIPQVILDVYAATPELIHRYPNPNNLFEPDNLLFWAQNEGKRSYSEIAAYLASQPVFSKHLNSSRIHQRSAIRNLPPIPEPGTQWFTDHRVVRSAGRNLRQILSRAFFHYRQGGWSQLWKHSRMFLARQTRLLKNRLHLR
jgi:uncharacterized protein YbaR (Trm112 family)/SAM-dependent methyltransferase